MDWLLALGFVGGALLGWWIIRRKPKIPYLLHIEYWVYLPGDVLPPQDEIMTHLVRPESGPPAIGSSEALLFSDVRLHVALVLRSKNGHVFRPDLLEPHVDATPEDLLRLDAARSLAKVRFISEQPVSDRRPIAFLPQLARAIAELGESAVVYDAIGERLLAPDGLRNGDPGPHIRWVAEPSGGHVRTHGLKKLGLPEIRTAPVAADERWIVSQLVESVARDAWTSGILPPVAVWEAFEDRFRIDLQVSRDGVAMARIHRIQEA